jgi:hypothetical protein
VTSDRWPELPVLGDVILPALPEDADQVLWPGLLDLADQLPAHHVVIGGVMVHLHGAVAGNHSQRPTRDVDVLLDVGVVPSSIRDAVQVLHDMGYRIAQDSPDESSHRYIGPAGELVDVLAPAGVKPKPDLTTTPPGQTIEVYAGQGALQHRVLIRASYGGRVSYVPVPDLPRAMLLKAAAYKHQWIKSQVKAFDSRHLTDLVHLVALIDDVTRWVSSRFCRAPVGAMVTFTAPSLDVTVALAVARFCARSSDFSLRSESRASMSFNHLSGSTSSLSCRTVR